MAVSPDGIETAVTSNMVTAEPTADVAFDRELVLVVFAEVNEHLRTTEIKQLSISTAYMSVFAVVLSLVAAQRDQFFAASVVNLVVFGVVVAIGCVVFVTQRWYRVWKEHYIDVLASMATTFPIPATSLPYWLRPRALAGPSRPLRQFSIDNTVPYFTVATTIVAIALFDWTALQLVGRLEGVVIALATSLGFAGFLFYLQRRITREVDLIA